MIRVYRYKRLAISTTMQIFIIVDAFLKYFFISIYIQKDIAFIRDVFNKSIIIEKRFCHKKI